MNRTYAISLTAMDEDDDAINCRLSRYVEAGTLITSHKIRNANVDLVSIFGTLLFVNLLFKNHLNLYSIYINIMTMPLSYEEIAVFICSGTANEIGFGICRSFFTCA